MTPLQLDGERGAMGNARDGATAKGKRAQSAAAAQQRARFAEDTVEFMSHPCFRQLRSAADVRILLFEDLDDFDLPEGYTKEEIWRILTAIRKQAAVMIPEDPERTADMWMVTTSALSFDAEMMEVRAKGDSSIGRGLREVQGSPFATRFLEETLFAGLAAEDIAVDPARIHELYSGEAPATPLDRLVTNYFGLSSRCDALAHREVTHGLIETLYYDLIEGVDLAALPERHPVPLDPRLPPPESQVLMDLVCARVREGGDDVRFGPVLRLVNIMWFFRFFNVVPHLNVLVGLLLRNIIAIKWGLPVLAWLPDGSDPAEGEDVVDAARQRAVFEHWSQDFGFGFDFTPYFELNVKRYLHQLERLAGALVYLERLNSQVERLFAPDINHRQKSILSSLIREPEAVLRIAPHQRGFRIAYGTARADFLSLERQGYLVREQEGRAFVFRAHPNLRERIDQLGAELSAEASTAPLS